MKKILIIGSHSYIGLATKEWIEKDMNTWSISMLSVRDELWKSQDFSKFDVIVHTAAVVHQGEKNFSKQEFFDINFNLPLNVAKKAKKEGVSQFVFLSTMSVFGDVNGKISAETQLRPTNDYGKSKLEAENALRVLEDEKFKVAIIRSPMVYGKNCPGNYQRLSKTAKKFFIFPKTDNIRSMLFIEYLCEFVRLIIKNEDSGIFYPQNREYVVTSELVEKIALFSNRKIFITSFFSPLIQVMTCFPGKIGKVSKKVFGSCYYDIELSKYKDEYRLCSFTESIKKTEI